MVEGGSGATTEVPRSRQRIFVVDDNAAIRDILTAVLTRRGGYQVVSAEDGPTALARLENDCERRGEGGERLLAVDLLVVDIMMPNMTGLELLEILRGTYAVLPRAIVISALDDEAHVTEALQLGAVDYVPKPIDTGLFLHRVQALFGTASDTPFHWASLPERPPVTFGGVAAHGRAISEGGIIVQRPADEGPAVGEVVPLASPLFEAMRIPRQLHGRVVRVTKLGPRTITELAFVGLPERELHGIRRFSISR